ncbi:hypothetical protein K501DRAFT_168348 [Backusella circina FSU 941]|nr:hypothetical protein K501DRAFT_168348 [Backusella circina FSU 941]
MAAVSFLEVTNLVGLGLSADRVFSHITDLNATKVTTPPNSSSSLKIVSDVMDSSYRVFDGIGKLWQRGGKDEDKLSGEGPMAKFLQVKSVDELKIGDVKELLADYKRLAAIMKQAGLA